MDWISGIGATGGLIGTGLGIFNTITGYRRGIRRLRIDCGYCESSDTQASGLWCEVVNPGQVPVVVTAVRVTLIVEGKLKETAIYGDSTLEARMMVELKPGTPVRVQASARYEPFFLRLCSIYARTGDGRVVRISKRRLRKTQAKLRASIEQRRLRDLAEATPSRDAIRASNNFPT